MNERLTVLQERLRDLEALLKITEKRQQTDKMRQLSAGGSVWDDQQTAQKTMRSLTQMGSVVSDFDSIEKRLADTVELNNLHDDGLADEIQEEIVKIEQEVDALEQAALFAGTYDGNDALLTIHAGTGGVDAQDWAAILERMYLRYCEQKGWRTTVLDTAYGEEAGIKRVEIEVSGGQAYGYLKAEHGVHRLVRLSPFNAKHSRETSFVLVEVIPLLDSAAEVKIQDDDIRIDVFRARGHGGQSVNTTDSAVRITHVPTGIVVSCQNERSQLQNKRVALKILQSRLAVLEEAKRSEELQTIRGQHVQGSWGNQIRSYVFQPYTMVKDHRTEHETSNVQAVLDGSLDDFIVSWLKKSKA
jgi:peptide chain release factor 2